MAIVIALAALVVVLFILFLGGASDSDSGGAEGVIAQHGGAFGDWGLYAKEGVLKYCYNFIDLDRTYVEAERPLVPGERPGAVRVPL